MAEQTTGIYQPLEFKSSQKKLALTKYPVHDLIRQRWSARSFADRPIEHDTLMTLFEAASWTFSAMNAQPWRFVYSHQGTAQFADMVDCLSPGNQRWARHAAVLIASLVRLHYEDGSPNSAAHHDVGAAHANLLLQATSMHIYGHLMGGFDKNASLEYLGLDGAEFDISVFIALGYLDVPEVLDEPFRTRELTARTRKSVEEFTFELK